MTLGRGGLGLFDKLRDRGFPSPWRFQEFRDVNLPAIRTGYVRPVLLRPAHMAADYIGNPLSKRSHRPRDDRAAWRSPNRCSVRRAHRCR